MNHKNLPYKALVFDLDNTLLDYDSAAKTALKLSLTNFKLNGNFADIHQDYSVINTRLWEQLERNEITSDLLRTERFRILGKKRSWAFSDWDLFSQFYLKQLGQQTTMYPETIPTLKVLSINYQLGCLTNGISDVQRSRLALSGLNQFFKSIIISSEHGTAKPDPEIFFLSCRSLGVNPSEMLYIGDSVTSDMQGAQAAGIDFWWYHPFSGKSDIRSGYQYKIETLDEIPLILEQLGSGQAYQRR